MPLRPELYHRLNSIRCLGGVVYSAEGDEMRATYILNGVSNRVELSVLSPGEYYRVNCPFCNDTRHRLWINHRWGWYDPKAKSDHIWLAHCYNEECLKTIERQRALYNMVFDRTHNREHDHIEKGHASPQPMGRVEMPGTVLSLEQLQKVDPGHEALTYIRSRGYDPIWLSRAFEVGVCVDPKPQFQSAFRRIIIPIMMNGKLVGWQGRYVGDPSDGIPKYYTMTGMKKSQILYNFDVAKSFQYVALVEGPTDVWRVGPFTAAMLGKSLSAQQKRLLAQNWGQGVVIIMLDADAAKEAKQIEAELEGLVRQRVVVQLPDGLDPGDMTTDDIRQLIVSSCTQQGLDLALLSPANCEPAATQ